MGIRIKIKNVMEIYTLNEYKIKIAKAIKKCRLKKLRANF